MCEHSKETLRIVNPDEKEKKLEMEIIEHFKYFSIQGPENNQEFESLKHKIQVIE